MSKEEVTRSKGNQKRERSNRTKHRLFYVAFAKRRTQREKDTTRRQR